MAKPSKHKYYNAATVKDELDGSIYTLGSTVENLSVEISGNTHPFYTGQETLVDTAGRIDKFRAKVAAASDKPASDKVRSKKGKQKMSLAAMMKQDEQDAKSIKPAPKKAKKEAPVVDSVVVEKEEVPVTEDVPVEIVTAEEVDAASGDE